jgi:D-sedoheptulose 7-phosphate isomerase
MRSETIKDRIQASMSVKQLVFEDESLLSQVDDLIILLKSTLKLGNQVLICGNGGSAADALHLAAEFSGRFYLDRQALPVEALNVNEAALTAIANDFGYDKLFARLVQAKGRQNDMLWLLTTSGASQNIIHAAIEAKNRGLKVVAFTGQKASELDKIVDVVIKVPSTDTPRIQECQLMLGHIICELIEKELFDE